MPASYIATASKVAEAFSSVAGGARLALDWAALVRVLAEHRIECYERKSDASNDLYVRSSSRATSRSSRLQVEIERIVTRLQSVMFSGITRSGDAWARFLEVRLSELQACLEDFHSDPDPHPRVRARILDEVRIFLQEAGELLMDQACDAKADVEALQSLFVDAGTMPAGVATRRSPVDDECDDRKALQRARIADVPPAKAVARKPKVAGVTEAPWDVVRRLGRTEDIERVRSAIAAWVASSSPAVRPMLDHQFTGLSKFFRPLTIFGCHYALRNEPVPDRLIVTAQAVEMLHNVTLIIDDLVDGSDERRGKSTLHVDYGELTAYMVAGYITADAYDLVARRLLAEVDDLLGQPAETGARLEEHRPDAGFHRAGAVDLHRNSALDADGLASESLRKALDEAGPVRFDLRLLSELVRRLCVAECIQWANRGGAGTHAARVERNPQCRPAHVGRLEAPAQRPLGLADWRLLAREDTGCMFEICAVLGARSQRFRRFGRLLGMLYHGCDDVADVSEAERLGGGKDEDVRDRILTLPAALAIQHSPRTASLFYCDEPAETPDAVRAQDAELLAAYKARLPDAEAELDNIRRQLDEEISGLGVPRPEALRALADSVRTLSH